MKWKTCQWHTYLKTAFKTHQSGELLKWIKMYNRVSWLNHFIFLFFFLQMVILKSYKFFSKQSKEFSLPWSSCCYIGNMQKSVLLQFHLDLSTDKRIQWQDVGETPNIGQDGGRALQMHREVHTGWESRKDTLEKETRAFKQGKAAQIWVL